MSYPGVPLYRCVLVRDGVAKRWPRAELRSSWQAASIVSQLTEDSPVERLCCIYLDARNKITGAEVVASGSEGGVSISCTAMLRGAIVHCARSVIIGHNHPSDDPEPSPADIVMTRAMQRACSALDIHLHDHVVVSHSNGHRSIRDLLGDSW